MCLFLFSPRMLSISIICFKTLQLPFRGLNPNPLPQLSSLATVFIIMLYYVLPTPCSSSILHKLSRSLLASITIVSLPKQQDLPLVKSPIFPKCHRWSILPSSIAQDVCLRIAALPFTSYTTLGNILNSSDLQFL